MFGFAFFWEFWGLFVIISCLISTYNKPLLFEIGFVFHILVVPARPFLGAACGVRLSCYLLRLYLEEDLFAGAVVAKVADRQAGYVEFYWKFNVPQLAIADGYVGVESVVT